ncbi:MAG: hypothetical protein IPI11_10945 [Haliscomenobacter sp.]|nr:hypothetical protein [Haliscomenobacter sp.]
MKLSKAQTEEQKGIAAEPKPIYNIDKLQEQYFSADELSLLKESFNKSFLTEDESILTSAEEIKTNSKQISF